uniref:Uncharacterized protein n=1 Tax=Tetranychus urticae TaxID=32264 RepID=T1JRW2_TETUR
MMTVNHIKSSITNDYGTHRRSFRTDQERNLLILKTY